MGHEYKLLMQPTLAQHKALVTLLESHSFFHRRYHYAGQEIREFRHPDNHGKMPNLCVIFEPDGLYICQNGAPYPWQHLGALKSYLAQVAIAYSVLDYNE